MYERPREDREPLQQLDNREALHLDRYVTLFGGKGGVGKTTCSAAAGLHLASTGKKTIIISSDLAPSLSDIFEMHIGSMERLVDGNLYALEIGQEEITARWQEKFGPDFYEILSRLMDVDNIDSESEHKLAEYIGSAPALKEETTLDYILELAESRNYDAIVWDTAPAGETLGLLGMPRLIKEHLRAGAKVYEAMDRIGKGVRRMARSVSEIMDEWIKASERIADFLKNPQQTEFIVVTNPDGMVVNHTQRLIETLHKYEVGVHAMIINRVVTEADSEFLIRMRESQRPYLEQLLEYRDGMKIVALPISAGEIKGLDRLRQLNWMFSG